MPLMARVPLAASSLWQAADVTIALDRMLQRVVIDVFGSDADVAYSAGPKSPGVYRAELKASDWVVGSGSGRPTSGST